MRRRKPRFAQENVDENRRIVERLPVVVERLGILPSQLVLAWVLSDPAVVAVPGRAGAPCRHHRSDGENSPVRRHAHRDRRHLARVSCSRRSLRRTRYDQAERASLPAPEDLDGSPGAADSEASSVDGTVLAPVSAATRMKASHPSTMKPAAERVRAQKPITHVEASMEPRPRTAPPQP